MANQEHLDAISKGGEYWNEWRLANPDVKSPDLSDAHLNSIDLRNANLAGVNFFRAQLGQADFRGANMTMADCLKSRAYFADFRGAKFDNTTLSEADLTHARFENTDARGAFFAYSDLESANFDYADLTGVNFQFAHLRRANFSNSILNGANLSGTILEQAIFTDAELERANLSLSTIVSSNFSNAVLNEVTAFGVSVWKTNFEGAIQTNIRISDENEPTFMVDDLEVAQFIYLLLNREKLRNVLNAMTRKGVLILGRFQDGGLEVLQSVAAKLREMGYLPMLFDFKPSNSRDFTETVKTMVGLARFVIVDLSGPSVLKELEATVPDFEVPFIPVIEEGRQSPSMTTDLSKYPWFRWPPVIFANREMLVEMLPDEVIAPAEEIGKQREERRAKLFPNVK